MTELKTAARSSVVALALLVSGGALLLPAAAPAASAPAGPPCRVRVGALQDLRADPETMGNIGGKTVQAVDGKTWLTTAVQTLGADGKITLLPADAAEAEVDLGVDLLKAYVASQAMAKTANVVLRVHYGHAGGSADDVIYRGITTGTNWASTQSESKGALNHSLADAIAQIKVDVLKRCAAPK